MLWKLLLILSLLTCGRAGNKPHTTTADLTRLQAKSDTYQSLIAHHRDSEGFILTEECDSLLFTGLYGAGIGNVNITAARDGVGQWYRRPGQDCGPKWGNSRSTISRDMFIGLYWYVWRSKDLKTARELLEYATSHSFTMGSIPSEGTVGELLLNSSMIATLAELVFRLGGENHYILREYPAIFSPGATGFVAHLQVWHILLRGELLGEIPDSYYSILKSQAERQPNNPLYLAAYSKYKDGNQAQAISLLLDSPVWPADRLPSSYEICAEWVVQRDFSTKDWAPCPERNESYLGAELVAITELIIK
jgi:hypothetical protein